MNREQAIGILIFGDLDKPFHLPECECECCEQWRIDRGKLTRKEIRKLLKEDTGC